MTSESKDSSVRKSSAARTGDRPFALWPPQRRIVESYASLVGLKSGHVNLLNEHFREFKQMVLSLPNCTALGDSEVIDIALGGAVLFFPKRRELANAGGEIYDLSPELARYYVEYLESLPRKYSVRISLPSLPILGKFHLQLADNISLDCAAASRRGEPEGLSSSAIESASPPIDECVVLEIRVDGFASHSLESQGIADAIALAKQCSFLLEVTESMQVERWVSYRSKAALIDHANGQIHEIELPERLAEHLGCLQLVSDRLTVYSSSGGLLGGYRAAETSAEKIEALDKNLRQPRKFFSGTHLPGFHRIAAAIEWHQDSVLDDDQTMAFLAACIGLESIFGDEESITELSKRLGDRYAFMLGQNRADRERLVKEFAEILVTRGALVHARARRLRGRDRQQLDRVRAMLKDSIRHELNPFFAQD